MKIMQFFEWLRKRALNHGYACDLCGKELFDYPRHRLCTACEQRLLRPKRRCDKCGRETRAEGICLDCKRVLPRFTKGFSSFVYKGECARAVNLMKNGNPRLAAYFGEEAAASFFEGYELAENEPPLLIVAVPLTDKKKRERGYNQAERLAESVADSLSARNLSVELAPNLLEKRRETQSQKLLSRKERAKNVSGAFFVRNRKRCKNRRILLVDDVCTTGATGNECAARLLGAGAKAVYFLTVTALPESN